MYRPTHSPNPAKKDISKGRPWYTDGFSKKEYNETQKYNHVCRLLANTNAKIKQQFKYDGVAIDSITHFDIARDISLGILDVVGRVLPNKATYKILDAFACVGGNTISFCQHGFGVDAVELDSGRFSMLEWNVGLFGLKPKLYNGDALNHLGGDYDVVFIDVPWDNRIDGTLYVGTVRLRDIVALCAAKIVVLKLPLDYDIVSEFGELAKKMTCEVYDEPSKMLIATIVY